MQHGASRGLGAFTALQHQRQNATKDSEAGSAPAIGAGAGQQALPWLDGCAWPPGVSALHPVLQRVRGQLRVVDSVELAGLHASRSCLHKPSCPEASRHQILILAPTRFPRLPSACHLFSCSLQSSRPLPRPLHSLLCPSAALHLISSCLFGLLTPPNQPIHRESSSARQSRRSAREKSTQHHRTPTRIILFVHPACICLCCNLQTLCITRLPVPSTAPSVLS